MLLGKAMRMLYNREVLETALDSWFLAKDLCVVQWHMRCCILYLANQETQFRSLKP